MDIFNEIAPLRAFLNKHHFGDISVGLVPTMGALHHGHLSLIRASKKENTMTVCSIYVNPTQFGNKGDFEKYPRTLQSDLSILENEGCDVVFCPDNATMYDQESTLSFDFGNLDKVLEGLFRPGHFSGVALVVSKLFNIIKPNRAYFGQKDFQQFRVISQLVEELKFDVKLACLPIVRENDGLAMSSRNKRLSALERKQASILYQCLLMARERIMSGKSMEIVQAEAKDLCTQNSVNFEYLVLIDKSDFAFLDKVSDPNKAILLIAAQVGGVRLIDNILFNHSS